MAIPEFNRYGLLPKGIYLCTFKEVYDRFGCVNDIREDRWTKFMQYVQDLKHAEIANVVYIDGSFVTNKPNPSDIDIVIEVKGTLKKTDDKKINKLFNNLHNRNHYSLEVFPYMQGQSKSQNDFRKYFGYIKPRQAKSRGMALTANTKRNFYKGILKVKI